MRPGVPDSYIDITDWCDLNSGHSTILCKISSLIIKKAARPSLCNNRTKWYFFLDINQQTPCNQKSIKYSRQDQVNSKWANWNSTARSLGTMLTRIENLDAGNTNNCPLWTEDRWKWKATRAWKLSRCPVDETRLNELAADFKALIQDWKNETYKDYTQNMFPNQYELSILFGKQSRNRKDRKFTSPFL